MTRFRMFAVGLLAALLALAVAVGCHRERTDDAVVDMELMAFLSEARALHHQANLKEEMGDVSGATFAMQRLVAAPRPHDGKAPEVKEVLADAYARLAELELGRGALGPATEAIVAGLALAPDPTYFRGHLLEIQGLVEKTRGSELADAGRGAEATAAQQNAMRILEEVVKIQEQVILRSLASRDASADRGGSR